MNSAKKRCIRIIAVIAIAGLTAQRAQAQLQAGDLVAICGDSITEQKDYSADIQAYLLACQPAANLNAVQFGWSGEVAGGLVRRYESNVKPFKPQVATTCYGMNDGRYKAVEESTLKAYRESMEKIVALMKESGVRTIVVGSPGIVDPVSYRGGRESADEYNVTLKALADVAKEIAAQEQVIFADVYSAMMASSVNARAKYGESYRISGDGVHPYPNGHLPMAYAFLKALGCDGAIGTITVDFSAKTATSDEAQKVLGYQDGVVELESTRYPFSLSGAPKPDSQWGMAQCMPFNADLNRYKLVVKNAPVQAKVTWGTESHDYTKAELERGINLAADFVEHPLKAPFENVMRAVRERQNFETEVIKNLMNSLGTWQRFFPENEAAIATLGNSILGKSAEVSAKSRVTVIPVKHSLKIEAF